MTKRFFLSGVLFISFLGGGSILSDFVEDLELILERDLSCLGLLSFWSTCFISSLLSLKLRLMED